MSTYPSVGSRRDSSQSSRYLSGYSNRQLASIFPQSHIPRHPTTGRILRSSPLAGPSISDDGQTDLNGADSGDKPRYRPSIISSTPNLLTVVSNGSGILRDEANGRNLANIPLAPSLASVSFTPSVPSLKSDSTTSPTASELSSTEHLKFQPASPTPSVSRDPSQNWVTMTSPTPHFSRLGLGKGVVMPVSAKAHRSNSRPGSPSARHTPPSPRISVDSEKQRSIHDGMSVTSHLSTLRFKGDSSVSFFPGHDFGVLELPDSPVSQKSVDEVPMPVVQQEPPKRKRNVLVRASTADKAKRDVGQQPAVTVELKKAGSIRKKWNSLVATVRR